MKRKTIHKKQAGPYAAPKTAPKTGPRPAMFKNWIKKIFHTGILTKSIPSAYLMAGVFLSSEPKTFSTIAP